MKYNNNTIQYDESDNRTIMLSKTLYVRHIHTMTHLSSFLVEVTVSFNSFTTSLVLNLNYIKISINQMIFKIQHIAIHQRINIGFYIN